MNVLQNLRNFKTSTRVLFCGCNLKTLRFKVDQGFQLKAPNQTIHGQIYIFQENNYDISNMMIKLKGNANLCSWDTN